MDKNFKLITLNVGGKKFTTYYTFKESSYFQQLFENKKAQQASIIEKDNDQVFFIDRDGEVFEEVMHYLRSLEIRVDTPEDLEKLKIEATFFDIKELVLKVDQALLNVNNESDDENYYLEAADSNAKEIKANCMSLIAIEKERSIIGKIQCKDKNGKNQIYLIIKARDKH